MSRQKLLTLCSLLFVLLNQNTISAQVTFDTRVLSVYLKNLPEDVLNRLEAAKDSIDKTFQQLTLVGFNSPEADSIKLQGLLEANKNFMEELQNLNSISTDLKLQIESARLDIQYQMLARMGELREKNGTE